MYIAVAIIHVIVSVFLVIVVLLQSGKAADLAGAFGGLGSQTVFGPRGSATVLTRATTASAVIFMLTSLTLSILSTGQVGARPADSILDKISAPPQQSKAAPATKDATKDASKSDPNVLDVINNINKGAPKGNEVEVQIPPAPAPAPAKK